MIEKRCKQHQNFILIERVVVENFFHFEDGEPLDTNDWKNEPVQWYSPRRLVLTVMCQDCGFEHFYGPDVKLPKWVQKAWDSLQQTECTVR